jgi:hypothetical protein
VSKSYLSNITPVALQDASELAKKDKEYGGSWKKRGGVGAFMMLARKWDRIEKRMEEGRPGAGGQMTGHYDIFDAIHCDPRSEGIIDDIRDLRRYLLLVEAEMVARGVVATPAGSGLVWTVGAGQQLNASGGSGGEISLGQRIVDANTAAVDKLQKQRDTYPTSAEKRTYDTAKVEHPAPFGYDEKEE